MTDWRIWECDALQGLKGLQANQWDAVLADPPYSSGGLMRSDRQGDIREKYQVVGSADFGGDSRDQRSWTAWCAHWLYECHRVVRPGGVCMVFTDWRQLPSLTDAFQMGGWVWRGIVVWDKTDGAKPSRGRFKHQCEYLVWGSKGGMPLGEGYCHPGLIRCSTLPSEKLHPSGKPLPLLRELLRIVPPEGQVLDPFAGSASVGQVCVESGLDYLGLECNPHWAAIARERLERTSLMLPETQLPIQQARERLWLSPQCLTEAVPAAAAQLGLCWDDEDEE